MSNATENKLSGTQLVDEAFELMERAQVLLDRAGLTQAAAHLDHALASIPDASGIFPRKRKNPPPTF